MSEETIVRNAAPTLAGLKSGNLFTCDYNSRSALEAEVRKYNAALAPKGIVMLILRWSERKALIYLFRPGMLRRDLSGSEALPILAAAGYEGLSMAQCLRRLRDRLSVNTDFPHEIGLFLSYPPEDVRGFIEHRDTGCKQIGCWRVYSDVEAAEEKFRQFKMCTDSYCRRSAMGVPMERLAVAV